MHRRSIACTTRQSTTQPGQNNFSTCIQSPWHRATRADLGRSGSGLATLKMNSNLPSRWVVKHQCARERQTLANSTLQLIAQLNSSK